VAAGRYGVTPATFSTILNMNISYKHLYSVALDDDVVLKPVLVRVFGGCFAESRAEFKIRGSAARMVIASGGYVEDLWDKVESDPPGALVISRPAAGGGAHRLTVHTGPLKSAMKLALAPPGPGADDDGHCTLGLRWGAAWEERIVWEGDARAMALLPPIWAQEPAHLAHLGFWLRSVLGIVAGEEKDPGQDALWDTFPVLQPLLAEWGHILLCDDALFRFPWADPGLLEHRLRVDRLAPRDWG
jgi:hypothetical protein